MPSTEPGPDAPAPNPAAPPGASRVERMRVRLGTVGELIALFARGGRWWMIPLVLMLVLAGSVLVFLQSMQYLAPFIYAVL